MAQREMVYLLPGVVIVFDRVQSTTGTVQTWQLVSPVKPAISGSNATFANAGHKLKVQKIRGGTLSITCMPTVDSDYTGGYRLDETWPGGNNRYLNILSLDGIVSSATAITDATHFGVTVRPHERPHGDGDI